MTEPFGTKSEAASARIIETLVHFQYQNRPKKGLYLVHRMHLGGVVYHLAQYKGDLKRSKKNSLQSSLTNSIV